MTTQSLLLQDESLKPVATDYEISEERAVAIDAAMQADKLRNGYEARRLAAAERAELKDATRHARMLYPRY
jgi:hypothetical protein